LNGRGDIQYAISLRGDAAAACTRIARQPWVTAAVDTAPPDHGRSGAPTLLVRVTDERAAEDQLLRLVLDDQRTTVLAFGRQKQNLEAIFLQIAEGGRTHGNDA
jgi:hypothetical protein